MGKAWEKVGSEVRKRLAGGWGESCKRTDKVLNPSWEKFRSFLGQGCQKGGRELAESWDLGEARGARRRLGKGCEKLGGESCQNSRRNLAENWEKAGRKLGEGAEAAREKVGACWQKL